MDNNPFSLLFVQSADETMPTKETHKQAFFQAVESGNHELIVKMLQPKFGKKVPVTLAPYVGQAMICALNDGYPNVVVEMLKHCVIAAYINERDAESNTLLMIASKKGWVEAVTALIRAGADVRAKNHEGEMALDVAANHHILFLLMTKMKITEEDLQEDESNPLLTAAWIAKRRLDTQAAERGNFSLPSPHHRTRASYSEESQGSYYSPLLESKKSARHAEGVNNLLDPQTKKMRF